MANRAYLYATDLPAPERWERPASREGDVYFDSRWTIPVAWFFFFRPQDLVEIDVEYGGSTWQEPRFAAPKEVALETFRRNRPLLMRIVGEAFDSVKRIDYLLDRVGRWPERDLLIEPSEVAQSDDEDIKNFAAILTAIESGEESLPDLRERLRFYSRLTYEDDEEFELHVVGYTYGR